MMNVMIQMVTKKSNPFKRAKMLAKCRRKIDKKADHSKKSPMD